MKIYGTITLQEVIALCITAMLFVAQPFGGAARVAFIALAVAGVWVLYKDRRLAKSIGIKQLGLIVLLIGVPGILSLWNSVNVEETRKFILFLPIFFFAGATIYSLFMNEKLLAVLTTIIAITSIVWILDGIYQYFTGSDLLGNPLVGTVRVSGPFTNTHLGMLLTVTLPVTLKWLKRFGLSSQIVYILLLAFTLCFAGVRTDILTFFFGIIVFYCFYFRTTRKKVIFIACFVLLLFSVGWIAISVSDIAEHKFDATIAIFQDGDFRSNSNTVLSGRVEIWEAGLSMFKEEPVTGIGALCFQDAYETHKPNEEITGEFLLVKDAFHAHHVWIGTLAETGIVGFIGLAGAVMFLVLLTCRSRSGFNLYTYPWMLSFLLIVNPLNSMMPIFKLWWVPIVLLVIVVQLVELHRNAQMDLHNVEQ